LFYRLRRGSLRFRLYRWRALDWFNFHVYTSVPNNLTKFSQVFHFFGIFSELYSLYNEKKERIGHRELATEITERGMEWGGRERRRGRRARAKAPRPQRGEDRGGIP
jgi:hypothetical protein